MMINYQKHDKYTKKLFEKKKLIKSIQNTVINTLRNNYLSGTLNFGIQQLQENIENIIQPL